MSSAKHQLIKLAIDGNEANVKNRVGSNVYAFEILKALEQLTYRQRNIKVTVLLSEPKAVDLPKVRRGWHYEVITPAKFWTQLALPAYLFQNQAKFDLFYTPGHYAPRHCPIPYVSSVMDLAYLKYPHQFTKKDYLQLKNWTSYSVKQAVKVITISQFSKNEIVSLYHRLAEDVVVAYPAVSPAPKITPLQAKLVKRKLKVSDHYLLFVGTIQPRKNLLRLIEAFEQLCLFLDQEHFHEHNVSTRRGRKSRLSIYQDLQLVIAGQIGWLAKEIIERVKASPFKDKIVLTGFVSEKAKQVLINQAETLALVGFYEGFGIPPLEAMQHQVIPVVAKTSSLREVVGSAGIMVDPESVDSITLGLKEVLSLSTKQRAILLRQARDQLKKFSWTQSAQTILHTLEEIFYDQRLTRTKS